LAACGGGRPQIGFPNRYVVFSAWVTKAARTAAAASREASNNCDARAERQRQRPGRGAAETARELWGVVV
jgi:hypothetical protein